MQLFCGDALCKKAVEVPAGRPSPWPVHCPSCGAALYPADVLARLPPDELEPKRAELMTVRGAIRVSIASADLGAVGAKPARAGESAPSVDRILGMVDLGAPATDERRPRPAGGASRGGASRQNRRGWRDWGFLGFLAFAAVMSGLTGVHRVRLSRALGRAGACLAQADVACTGKAVEDARAIEAKHPRVRLADAGLQVLLRQPITAQAAVAAIERDGDKLPAEARGDLLLLKGDLAAFQGAPVMARGHYEAARLLVKDVEWVEARLRRIDGLASSDDAYFSSLISACEQIADAAENGETETVSLGVREQTPRLARVVDPEVGMKPPPLALAAVQRAVQEVDQRRRRAGFTSPGAFMEAPVEPVRDESPWARKHPELADRMYDQALDRYQRERDRYNAQKDALDRREMSQRRNSARVVDENLTSARRLIAEAADAFAQRRRP